jgi:hypothetical protein
VCTHMSRDNRCGVLGAQLARRLSSLVDGKGLDMVKVFQASHVGGHKVRTPPPPSPLTCLPSFQLAYAQSSCEWVCRRWWIPRRGKVISIESVTGWRTSLLPFTSRSCSAQISADFTMASVCSLLEMYYVTAASRLVTATGMAASLRTMQKASWMPSSTYRLISNNFDYNPFRDQLKGLLSQKRKGCLPFTYEELFFLKFSANSCRDALSATTLVKFAWADRMTPRSALDIGLPSISGLFVGGL